MEPLRPTPIRPFGVSVLAFLALISGVIGTFLAAAALLVTVADAESSPLVGALIAGFLGVVSLAFAWGAWLLQPWAWPLGVALWSLALLQAIVLLGGGQLNSNLVVAPICLFYLFRADIRAAFRR